jgi:hypothetical protein
MTSDNSKVVAASAGESATGSVVDSTPDLFGPDSANVGPGPTQTRPVLELERLGVGEEVAKAYFDTHPKSVHTIDISGDKRRALCSQGGARRQRVGVVLPAEFALAHCAYWGGRDVCVMHLPRCH